MPQIVKVGGNGPIVANALVALGLGGTLGKPALHPVFADFAKRAGVISLVEPRFTDAFEFACGKRMCGKLASLRDVNWRNLVKQIPEAKLVPVALAIGPHRDGELDDAQPAHLAFSGTFLRISCRR